MLLSNRSYSGFFQRVRSAYRVVSSLAGIAQFRIPGRTGASCVKTHQSEANAGKK